MHAFESGAFVNVPAWHNLGTVIEGDQDIDSETMIVKAGLDWEVETQPLYTKSEGEISIEIPVPEMRAVVRKSDLSVLGVVGNRYTPVQNKNAFAFFDAVVGGKLAIYHTAGALMGGKKIWLLARLPNKMIVGKNDEVEKYLLLSNSHDGKSALEMMFTPVRVQCWNTLSAALNIARKSDKPRITITHSASVEQRLKQAESSFAAAEQFFMAFNEHAQLMAKFQYSTINMKELLDKLFPLKEEEEEHTKATLEKRGKIEYLFDHGSGHDQNELKGTAWLAWQAVCEYADYHIKYRGTNKEDRRLNSIWYGNSADMKQNAYNIISSQMNA